MMHLDGFEDGMPVRQVDLAEWAAEMDGSTRLTWLWAALLGPIYFAAHGFHRQAVVVLLLDLLVVGVLLAPFVAHRAWRARARAEAAWLGGMLDARACMAGRTA